jgi:HD domain
VNIATHPLRIPDSKLAREVTEIVRDTESELLFNHSSRVYLFAALAGEHHGLKFDLELLYAGAMFHDMGLTKAHSSGRPPRLMFGIAPPGRSDAPLSLRKRMSCPIQPALTSR